MGTHSQAKYCSPECQREGMRESWRRYGGTNREARRAYYREHYRENRDEIIARTRAYQKTEAGRRAGAVSDARQREKWPEKYAARQAVLVAVRSGRLIKAPCKCGSEKVQAHHHDYSKPLEVEWLCRKCHNEEHGFVLENGALKT